MREPAKRIFAREFADSVPEDDHLLTPTGERCRRILISGELTQKISGEGYSRCRITDPTGSFMVFFFQKELLDFLDSLEIPKTVMLVGRISVYGDGRVSIHAESMNEIDQERKKMLVLDTAKQTIERIKRMEGEKMQKYREMVAQVLEELKETEIKIVDLI
jgi:hypothetical protein